MFVMRAWECPTAKKKPWPYAGFYLQAFWPNGNEGRGHVVFTKSIDGAIRFFDKQAAADLFRVMPSDKPEHKNGKPNMPLNVYTFELVPLLDSLKITTGNA